MAPSPNTNKDRVVDTIAKAVSSKSALKALFA
eukprot:CAMPEP_0206378050 /NCGR_PEP_ID=MMETSP0294-20121207/10515_1 /ASSEMBLY_ACC=CAM_ASM_000327 /TAXON_ID=39354 /ORGANISM="Heterosigma akashiwo, Strain CCMP2393" /LENGTH=31 /DNA_ID= /DNA_START= /DNA_END= /DNA_ORIENTATION=